MAEYQHILDPMTGKISTGILRTADNAFVPDDNRNLDWQQYQLWLEAGGKPDPAPKPPPPQPDTITLLTERIAALEAQLKKSR